MRKSFLNTLILTAIALGACSKYDRQVLLPPDAPNRQKDHKPQNCPPLWSGTYIAKNGNRKKISFTYDLNHSLTIADNDSRWVVNGKPQFMAGHPGVSYTAICAPVPLLDANAPVSQRGVIIEAYEESVKLFTITYALNMETGSTTGDAFDFTYLLNDPNKTQEEPSATYELYVTSANKLTTQ